MRPGIILKDDADLDYALHYKSQVEITLWGQVDYRGQLKGYNEDAVQAMSGDWYTRKVVEIRTV